MSERIIISNPEILGGIPCFRGTRVPFRNLLDYLENESLDEFLADFPSVGRELATRAIEQAGEALLAAV